METTPLRRVDLIAMNCQGWITGLLLSQLARMFIPFDTQTELSLDNIIVVKTAHGDAAITIYKRTTKNIEASYTLENV